MLKIIKKTLKKVLPESTRYRIKRNLERNRFQRYAHYKLDVNYRQVEPGLAPPKDLIAKTAAVDERDLAIQSQADVYFKTGYYEVLRILKILDHFSVNLRTIGSVFELGCGTARLLRHFRCLEEVRLVGSDVNSDMIEWCRKHLPDIEFYQNQLEPPLSFAEDCSFDLAIASSVFTHIPLHLQQQWLREIYRILRTNGYFICSVLGKNHQRLLLDANEANNLAINGNLTLSSEAISASLATKVGGSQWDVFQTRAEVIKNFGSIFQIIDYIPGGQDFLVLRKPDPQQPISIKSTPFPAELV
jgi:SAM-dependent methyltransferase